MSWIHRRCQDRIDALEAELRTVRDRIADRDRENAELRARADQAETARWDDAGEVVVLTEKVERLEKELTQYKEAETVPAQRRARAAWQTLWQPVEGLSAYTSWEKQEAVRASRAAMAQAILAMPVSAFAGTLTRRDSTYYLDGTPVHLPYSDRCGQVDALMTRYGLTWQEISAAMDEDRAREDA